MNLEQFLSEKVLECLSKLYGAEVDPKTVQFQKTKKEFEGDITLVTFPFLRITKQSPEQSGEAIGRFLKDNLKEIEAYNTVKGFLNLTISDHYWINNLNDIINTEKYGYYPENDKVMMVEYSSPNTNKPLHLGHLRNNFLGYSVAEILKANGYKVVKTQIINDRGIHICKSMLAWQKFGNGETPDSTGVKGDKLVGKYYVEFDKALKAETAELLTKWQENNFDGIPDLVVAEVNKLMTAADEKEDKAMSAILDKVKEIAKNQTPIMSEAKDMLVKWEAKDPEVYDLWETMNSWVYDGFAVTYNQMGVDFDTLYYESNTYLLGKDLVEKGLENGIFFKKDDGSVWIDLSDDGLDEKLVLRGDGTAVYMTQDMGTANQRFIDYPKLSGITYTVGNEQDYHFKVLFLILKKMGYAWADNCFHLSYGMVDLPTGKMKSREGTVVDADDLMAEIIEKAKLSSQERGHIDSMTEEEKNNLFNMIGLGGLKYYLLKVDPRKRMMFNPEESVDLNGNTGPFIQYTHARISSLLANGIGLSCVDTSVEMHPSEKELIKWMVDYPIVIKEAGKNYSPALIANYTYDLVKLYNSFYQSVSILKEEDKLKVNLRLQISKMVGEIISSSMRLLGITVPKRM